MPQHKRALPNRPAPAPKTPANAVTIKTIFFIVLLLGVSTLFGKACEEISRQYLSVILIRPEATGLAIQLFVSIALMAVTAGLTTVLVRPFWLTAIAFFLSALTIVFFAGFHLITIVAGMIYFAAMLGIAHSVVKKLSNQIQFSMHPLTDVNMMILSALILFVSASFGLGYFLDASQRNFAIPPELKQESGKAVASAMQSAAEKQGGKPDDKEIKAAVSKINEELDKMWTNLETNLKPSIDIGAFALGTMLFFLLQTLIIFVSWVPLLLISAIFPLLRGMHLTRYVVELRETKRLTLN